MECPELRIAVRRHIEHLRSIRAGIARPARQYRAATMVPAKFQRTCAPPEEELLVDSNLIKARQPDLRN